VEVLVEVLVEVPSSPLAEDTASLPPLLPLVLAVLLAAPPAPVALEVPTPSLPADSSAGSASSAGSTLPQASAKHDGKSARGSRLRVTPGNGEQTACHELPPRNRRAASRGSRAWHSLGQ
jgi:hypothetical protein